jgi:hypothetical protein
MPSCPSANHCGSGELECACRPAAKAVHRRRGRVGRLGHREEDVAMVDAGELLSPARLRRRVSAMYRAAWWTFLIRSSRPARKRNRPIDTCHESTTGHASRSLRSHDRAGWGVRHYGRPRHERLYRSPRPTLMLSPGPSSRAVRHFARRNWNVLQGLRPGFHSAAARDQMGPPGNRSGAHPRPRVPGRAKGQRRPGLSCLRSDRCLLHARGRAVPRQPPRAFDVSRPAPALDTLQRALDSSCTERPAIITGGGRFPSRRRTQATGGLTHIPVYTGKHTHVACDHRPTAGCRWPGHAPGDGSAPDLVLWRPPGPMYTGGRSGRVIPHGAKLIQVDLLDPEIG